MAEATSTPVNTLPTAIAERMARRDFSALCRRCKVRRLALFGSVTTGRFDAARSDLDFLVDFETLGPAAYATAYFDLREGLQVMFGREVDLVTEAALANPYFRSQVHSERQIIFDRI